MAQGISTRVDCLDRASQGGVLASGLGVGFRTPSYSAGTQETAFDRFNAAYLSGEAFGVDSVRGKALSEPQMQPLAWWEICGAPDRSPEGYLWEASRRRSTSPGGLICRTAGYSALPRYGRPELRADAWARVRWYLVRSNPEVVDKASLNVAYLPPRGR